MENILLEIKDINKVYVRDDGTKLQVLQSINMEVKKGEFVSIIGPSGCGKSTLLNMIAGIDSVEHGDIVYGDTSIIHKKGITSYMPQKEVLFPWRTTIENVIVPLQLAGVSKKDAEKEATKYLEQFGLGEFSTSYPHELSGGMRQRVNFLRTYLMKKEMMLLDEPFGKLDALTRMQLQTWLLSIWEKLEKTIVFVTHDIDEAILLSDRVYVLSANPGEVVGNVEITLPRPRTVDVVTTTEFMNYKRHFLELLR